MKGFVSHLILVLLLINVLAIIGFNVKPSKAWTGTVYIRANGSIDPPGAPIANYGNMIYILIDNITSNGNGIVVERDNIVIDGAGYTVEGSEGYISNGVDLSGRSNVTIKNMKIKKFTNGVYLDHSSNNTIIENSITANNERGVFLYHSSNNDIIGNNITANNILPGIHLYNSSNNNIKGNHIVNNRYGIYILDSSNNNIGGNVFVNDGLIVLQSYWNIVIDNLVNGKPLVYLEGASHVKILDAGQVILVNCKDVVVEGLNLSNIEVGLQLWKTNNTLIKSNLITNNDDYSAHLIYSSNNNIVGNNITANYRSGLYLQYSSNNVVSGNNIANNSVGVDLSNSLNNNISKNNIANNQKGINILSSSDNQIFHNNFINNTQQVYVLPAGKINVWDDGYPSGGNYWSDYTGVDLYSGPHQNETGSDSIGDTPYTIDDYNQDRYPLMHLFDDSPPVIGEPLQQPPSSEVQSGQEVRVWVNVTDFGTSVKNVTLWYRPNNETEWTVVNMTAYREIYEALWGATIPGYPNCTWITYKIVAYDNAENMAVKDNNGYNYQYHVIPEFSTNMISLLILAMLTSTAMIIKGKKAKNKT